MAMHQHSSFSEQDGSMDAALYQANLYGVEVIWWTDHDHRMDAWGMRKVVHFTSLTDERTDGGPWAWTRTTSGPVASSGGGIVQSPASPKDPIVGGSLKVACRSSSGQPATFGYFADSHPAGWNYQGDAFGQQWSVEVLPMTVGPDGYLELVISTSYHPATNARPAGTYKLSYRFGGPGTPGTRHASGLLGIIDLGVTVGAWNSYTITPSNDIAALWPDMHAEDFATWHFSLNAVSLGGSVVGYFDYLRFARPFASGDLPLQMQQRLEAAYAMKYPNVAQRQGLEVSRHLPHLNWFGGNVTINDSTVVKAGNNSAAYEAWLHQLTTQIHASGGCVSWNHPYGYSGGALLPAATQDALLSQIAAHLVGNKLLGCDILEVGYVSRSQVDLAHHVGLWDVLSRNGLFITGNGVTDDHSGQHWLTMVNNWTTTAWAPSISEAALLHALASGRLWTSSLAGFQGSLDLWADGRCPMGSVSISQLSSRGLQVRAENLPVGSSVEVVCGAVDYTGTTPNTALIARLPASSFVNLQAAVTVDTRVSCFVRLQVRNAGGAVVAVSNPLWLLREQPPVGIPPARAF